jgi:hypothetical protein
MAKPTPHSDAHRVNILISKRLHKAATARGAEFGGFGPYIERLIVADMKRKNSIAYRNGRKMAAAS